jgi:hypothetical protein
MKKNRFTFILLAFIAGAAFGISVLAVLSFVSPVKSPSPAPAISPINSVQAKALVARYKGTMKDKVIAFRIDKDELDAITNIQGRFHGTTEFRIYMGIDGRDTVGIVVGLDAAGRDDTIPGIFRTTSQHSGPCPPVCDVSSPIYPK